MKIRYTHYPCACFQENFPALAAASFAGPLECTATREWENGLYISLNNNDNNLCVMIWKYPDY
jgi:hypothetical protein